MSVKGWFDILSKLPVATLLAGISGYFCRVFQIKSRVRRMRRNLYREISNNYQKTVVRITRVTSVEGLRQAAAMRFTDKLDLNFDVWLFCNEEARKEMLFELSEAAAICSIYNKFLAIQGEEPSSAGYAHVRGKEAAAEVDDRLLDGTLDKGLYRNVSSPEAWRFMDDLLTGKRKSYRAYLNPL